MFSLFSLSSDPLHSDVLVDVGAVDVLVLPVKLQCGFYVIHETIPVEPTLL